MLHNLLKIFKRKSLISERITTYKDSRICGMHIQTKRVIWEDYINQFKCYSGKTLIPYFPEPAIIDSYIVGEDMFQCVYSVTDNGYTKVLARILR